MNSFLKNLFGGMIKNLLAQWHVTRCVLCLEKIFEVSVCDLTKGQRLGAVGEVNKMCGGARRKVLVFGYHTIVT